MDSLEKWEQMRIFGYMIAIVGVILFFTGTQMDPLSGEPNLFVDILDELSVRFKSLGEGLSLVGTIIFAISEGWRRPSSL